MLRRAFQVLMYNPFITRDTFITLSHTLSNGRRLGTHFIPRFRAVGVRHTAGRMPLPQPPAALRCLEEDRIPVEHRGLVEEKAALSQQKSSRPASGSSPNRGNSLRALLVRGGTWAVSLSSATCHVTPRGPSCRYPLGPSSPLDSSS